jgi:hypothetical protein
MVSVDQGLRGISTVLGVLSGGFLLILLYLTARLVSGIINLQIRPNILWTKDVSHEAIPRPKEFESVAESLRSLGVEYLGVLHSQLRAAKEAQAKWIFISSDKEVYAEVLFNNALRPVLVSLNTLFPNQAMISTRYPFGEYVITPQFMSRFASQSIENAWNYHRQQVANWQALHGPPLPMRNVQDVINAGEVWKTRYRRLDTQNALRLSLLLLVLLIAFVAATAGFAISALNATLAGMAVWGAFGFVTGLGMIFGSNWVKNRLNNPLHAVDA